MAQKVSNRKPKVNKKEEENKMTTAQPKTVTISEEELAELQALKVANLNKKANSQSKSKARTELIKRHRPEFESLIKQYGGKVS